MPLALVNLEDGFITSAEWTQVGDLVLCCVDVVGQPIEVTFSGIRFFKMSESRVHNWSDSNEIWKIEEISDSPLLKGIDQDNGAYWLQQTFGGYYQRSTSLEDPHQLHHCFVLSDYLDLELLCREYRIRILDE